MFILAFNHANKFVRGVKAFVILPEILLRDGFQTHQQTFTTAACGKFEQFQIIGEQHRGQPIPLHTQGNQSEDQLSRVFGIGDDVQVNEDKFAGAMLTNVSHYIGHRF